MRVSRQAVGVGLAVVLLAGAAATRSAHIPTRSDVALSPASPATPKASGSYHVPAAGERYAAGSILATPCPGQDTKPLAKTLFHAGAVVDPDYTGATLRVRSGGLLDLRGGHLNLVGGEYLASSDAGRAVQLEAGTYPVTIAEEWVESTGADHWFAAAEIRLSSQKPVRWQVYDGGVTDGASLAWFDPAARVRVRAAGYDAVADHRDYYEVVANWDSPCYYVDTADKDVSLGHDAMVIGTSSDGAYPMVVGYAADGIPVDVVVLGDIRWSALGLPGTPPSEDSDSASPVPVPAPQTKR